MKDCEEIEQFKKQYFWYNFTLTLLVSMLLTFNYHMLSYLTTLFKQVYLTALLSMVSELIAYIASGFVFEKLGIVKTYLICCLIALVGGVAIIVYGLDH